MREQVMHFLDVTKIAEQLGLSRQTVIRHLQTGQLPGKKLGGRWYSTTNALARFFDVPAPKPGK